MALEGLSKEQIEIYENELLSHVLESGAIGNVSLRSELENKGWKEELYWDIRNRLIERGILTTGRGRGGSVRKVLATPALLPEPTNQESPKSPQIPPSVERDLYQPMLEVIKGKWAQDNRLDSFVAEITASQGARLTGGTWTRPDITVASSRTFMYLPGRYFDLITFEIKPPETVDITIVYEALGHRRAATKSFALIHVPESKRENLQSLLDEISQEAKRFGVGLIVASDPKNYDTWEELVEAVRHEPDPQRLNDFLGQQVSEGFREQIVKWFK